MSANTLQAFDAVAQNIPTLVVAAMFQKDPQVLLAHPDQGIEKFEDLKKLTLFVSKEGLVSYFQWMKHDFGFREQQVKPYTFNPQPFLADKRSAMQGYVTSEPYAVETAGQVQAENLPARRPGFRQLFDPDRDAPRSGREQAGPGAALRRCLGDRLDQLSLRRQRRGECADQARQSRDDRRAHRLFDRQDEGVRHRRFRRHAEARHRRHDRRAHEELLRQDGGVRRGQGRHRLSRRPTPCNSSTRAWGWICGRRTSTCVIAGLDRAIRTTIIVRRTGSRRSLSSGRPKAGPVGGHAAETAVTASILARCEPDRVAARRRQDVRHRHLGARRARSRRARRRVPVAARAVGLRQVDGAAHHRGPERADARHRHLDGGRGGRAAAQHRLRVPGADADALGDGVRAMCSCR